MKKSYDSEEYLSDMLFKVNGGLIYLLQNSGKMGKSMGMCNDVTIRINQCYGGVNKMPLGTVKRLVEHLHAAANSFLLEECDFKPE